MSKIDLQDATTLTNETSFISLLNENSAEIETQSDNFLSLDGTSPNSMESNLDMNSNRIINLPAPVLSNDVVRLQDMVTYSGGGTIAAFPTTSAALKSAITDETGSGALVFGTSPTLTTPTVTNPTITTGTLTSPAITTPTITNPTVTTGTFTTPTLSNPTVTTGTFSAPVMTSPTVTTKISPTTDDGAPLGDTTHEFSDLFLASGGVINWNNGDVTATHSSNTLAFAGASTGYTFDAPTTATTISASNYVKTTAPSTQTNDFTVSDTQNFLICNKGSTLTVTLPAAASYTGRMLHFKTLQAFTVVSASSNVCPNTTNTPGTAVLPATAGAWCQIVSDGTNWIRMASSTLA